VEFLDIKALERSEVDSQKLAELTHIAMERSNLLAEDVTEETILRNISKRITNHCYDLIFIAEDKGRLLGS
jgi:recombinational DNA repair ATPase RecF